MDLAKKRNVNLEKCVISHAQSNEKLRGWKFSIKEAVSAFQIQQEGHTRISGFLAPAAGTRNAMHPVPASTVLTTKELPFVRSVVVEGVHVSGFGEGVPPHCRWLRGAGFTSEGCWAQTRGPGGQQASGSSGGWKGGWECGRSWPRCDFSEWVFRDAGGGGRVASLSSGCASVWGRDSLPSRTLAVQGCGKGEGIQAEPRGLPLGGMEPTVHGGRGGELAGETVQEERYTERVPEVLEAPPMPSEC